MSYVEWSGLKTTHERLKWARMRWQSERGTATTASAAAEALGMKENTYSAYEREPGIDDRKKKHTPMDYQRAMQFGKKFKVNWVWLLTGEEHPFARTEAQKRAVSMLSGAPEEAQEELVDVMQAILQRRSAS